MINAIDLMMKYSLTPAMARVLFLLINNKMVTHRMVEVDRHTDSFGEGAKPIATDGKVLVHRLRRRLAGLGIVINSQRGVGYWLDQASREKIISECKDEQKSLPLHDGGEGEAERSAA